MNPTRRGSATAAVREADPLGDGVADGVEAFAASAGPFGGLPEPRVRPQANAPTATTVNTIAAATVAQATVVLPGTVYNYGPDAFPVLREEAPQHPTTRKGAIRVELERRLQAATAQGVRTIIVRAGDFFGAHAGNNWFGQGLVKAGRPVAAISVPGRPGVGHQWAYLPDVARTMVELIERRDTLEPFARFHLGGHWDVDGTQMAQAVRRVAQRHGMRPTVRRFPWWLVWVAAPFVTTMREMLEMRYLWREPLRMDNARVTAALGRELVTPLDTAVEEALAGLGCLPRAGAAG